MAPGSTDLAAAGMSTAVNVGITLGALGGGLLLPGWGAQSTALAGGLLSLAALVVVLAEPRLAGPGLGAERPAARARVPTPARRARAAHAPA